MSALEDESLVASVGAVKTAGTQAEIQARFEEHAATDDIKNQMSLDEFTALYNSYLAAAQQPTTESGDAGGDTGGGDDGGDTGGGDGGGGTGGG